MGHGPCGNSGAQGWRIYLAARDLPARASGHPRLTAAPACLCVQERPHDRGIHLLDWSAWSQNSDRSFTILQKRKEHYSSTYNNAPMPNMQRLTWKGIALHAGHLPGYPASHGCVRLPVRFSELVFTVTKHGTPVIIADHVSPHHAALEPGFVLPQHVADDAKAGKQSAAVAAKAKPVAESAASSIVVSGRDRKAFLMIDGEIAFETKIDIVESAKPLGTHLFSLLGSSPDRHFLQWTAFDLDGSPDAGVPVDVWSNATLARIEYLDSTAITRMENALHPGSTMLITDYPAGPATRSGPNFTVVSEDLKTPGKQRL